MPVPAQSLDDIAQPSGWADIYALPAGPLSEFLDEIDAVHALYTIDGLPITALAPHPSDPDILLAATGPPQSLDFLPDAFVVLAT